MALMFVLLSPILLLIDAAYADDGEDDRVWGDYWRDVMLVLSIALLPWEKRS